MSCQHSHWNMLLMLEKLSAQAISIRSGPMVWHYFKHSYQAVLISLHNGNLNADTTESRDLIHKGSLNGTLNIKKKFSVNSIINNHGTINCLHTLQQFLVHTHKFVVITHVRFKFIPHRIFFQVRISSWNPNLKKCPVWYKFEWKRTILCAQSPSWTPMAALQSACSVA